ncbi:HD domain-containing protein [Heliobacillus mobilis]|uniref:HD domain-containing protein n=1 Tax=Heliobacterium mobile TaxID=28064 RepID=A0A6I3SKN5_HELMO|nr:HD domain-containing phosphohydrolase [Heliobacterium mobile]MTV49315.1 HD domain-containing protein [Heliobacterium mobile]
MNFFIPEYRVFALFRTIAVIAMVLWSYFYPDMVEGKSFTSGITFLILYSVCLTLLLFAKRNLAKQIYLCAFILDLLFLARIIPLTGGVNSEFFLGYILINALYSTCFGLQKGLIWACLSLILYLMINMPLPEGVYWGDLVLRGATLLVTTAVVGYLSDSVQKTGKELERKVSELSALTEVLHTINSSLELPQVLSSIVELSASIMKVKACTVHICEAETGLLRLAAELGFHSLRGRLLPMQKCFMGKAVDTGNPIVYITESKPDESCGDLLVREGFCCALSVPLVSRSRTLGVLTVFADEPHAFSDDEVQLMDILANQIGNAIENATLYKQQQDLHLAIVQAFVAAIDAKDSYTRGHSEYVHRYVTRMLERLEISAERAQQIATAAILHDIGKIGINSNILQKPGALTEEEYAEIKMHVTIGEQIISQVAHFRELAPIVGAHHEWYNGKGYPDGLKGEEIPLGARIIAVADCFEAMTANRVYRRALPKEVAIAEIIRCSGVQFDPQIVQIFVQLVEEGLLDDMSIQTQREKREDAGA